MPKETPDSITKSLDSRRENESLRVLKVTDDLVDFSSNDYLGFSRSTEIYNDAHEILESRNLVSNGSTGSRLLSGHSSLCDEVEKQIAEFHGEESALIFNSGYNANIGLFSSVPERHDCILYDEYIHASIREGIQLSHASSYKFKHNDFDHLRDRLASLKEKTRNFYVVTESVFSMDGDIPDLKELVRVCEADNIYVIIDEAHATGVFGERGEGIVQSLGIGQDIFARIHTFGKGMGCHGAAILGSNQLQQFLINFSRSFIYTTALPPHALATISSSYNHLQKTDQISQLASRIKYFKTQLAAHKLTDYFIDSDSSIQCCIIPSNKMVKKISSLLWQEKYDVRPILSPTVPLGQERLRFCLHSYNTEEEIERVTALLGNFLDNEISRTGIPKQNERHSNQI